MFWSNLFLVSLVTWMFHFFYSVRHLRQAKRYEKKSKALIINMNHHIATLRPGVAVDFDDHKEEFEKMMVQHRSVTDQWDAALRAAEDKNGKTLFWVFMVIVSAAGIAIW